MRRTDKPRHCEIRSAPLLVYVLLVYVLLLKFFFSSNNNNKFPKKRKIDQSTTTTTSDSKTTIHNHAMRHATQHHYHVTHALEHYMYTRQFTDIWNKLPLQIRDKKQKGPFKQALKNYLLATQKYDQEEQLL